MRFKIHIVNINTVTYYAISMKVKTKKQLKTIQKICIEITQIALRHRTPSLVLFFVKM